MDGVGRMPLVAALAAAVVLAVSSPALAAPSATGSLRQVGGNVYDLTIVNTGSEPVNCVRWTIVNAGGVDFTQASGPGNPAVAPDGSAFGAGAPPPNGLGIAPGASATWRTTLQGPLPSDASMRLDYSNPCTPGSDRSEVVRFPSAREPRLEVVKTASHVEAPTGSARPFAPGEEIVFTIVVKNVSSVIATNVRLNDFQPGTEDRAFGPEFEFVRFDRVPPGWRCGGSGTTANCGTSRMRPGAVATIRIVSRIVGRSSLGDNVAFVTSPGFAGASDDAAWTVADPGRATVQSPRQGQVLTADDPPTFQGDGKPVDDVLLRAPAIAAAAPPTGLARVQIALFRAGPNRRDQARYCRWLRSRRAQFVRKPRFRGRRCDRPTWLTAQGSARWSLALTRALPPGQYVLFARAVSRQGAREATFSARRGNRIVFRVRG